MKIKVYPEKTFIKALKKLPPDRSKAAVNSLAKFSEEPSTNSLRFRRLEGTNCFYIINGKHGDRIILRQNSEVHYSAIDVAPHDTIYKKWNR